MKYFQDNFINFSVNGKKYHSQEEATQATKNSLIPFGEYLDNAVDSKGLRVIPEEFKEKAYGLFAETDE